jgi:hypothetical protein
MNNTLTFSDEEIAAAGAAMEAAAIGPNNFRLLKGWRTVQ